MLMKDRLNNLEFYNLYFKNFILLIDTIFKLLEFFNQHLIIFFFLKKKKKKINKKK